MPERFMVPVGVLGLLIQDGHVLLLRRANTGWMDGHYDLPSGHIEGSETLTEAICREIREEASIIVDSENVHFFHLSHYYSTRENVHVYFWIEKWQGTPRIGEPDKCDDLQWFSLDSVPDKLTPTAKTALTAFEAKVPYSEDLNQNEVA